MYCIGHRGAAGLAPQNTIAGIQAAIDLGCTWVEVDIWHVADQLIVFHDRRLEKLTGRPGLLISQSKEQIATLRVNGTEPVPTLEEVFDVCTGKAGLNIELKGPNTAAALSSFLKVRTSHPQLLVSSFDHGQLSEFHYLEPQIPCGVLVAGYPHSYLDFAQSIDAVSVHLHIDFVQQRAIREIQNSGRKAFVFTVNFEDDIRLMQQLGVDAVFSDYPDRVFAVCGQTGQKNHALF